MLQPKPIRIVTQSGDEREYILSKFPAVAGREIIAKYPLSAMPKLGDYDVNEETMLKLMAYVGVPVEGREKPQLLSTRELVDNHVPDWETLARIEVGMLEYNCSFFGKGKASGFLDVAMAKGRALLSQMLTDLSAQSSRKEKQPSQS